MSRMEGNDLYFNMRGCASHQISDPTGAGIFFHCGGMRTRIDCGDMPGLSCLASSIHHFLGEERIVLSWSAKDIFSYVRSRTEMSMEVRGSLYDLSLISSYLSVDMPPPNTFREAVDSLKRLLAHPGWKRMSEFYRKVYVPLATTVLPEMESCCLVDNAKRLCVYPSYVMEGQANGRLKALTPMESNYNPHSLGPEQKKNLRPPGYEESFVCFDYRNMEVNVLQWLSGDKELGGILETSQDTYKSIWARIMKGEATDAHRRICKDVFLPVVFGQGARSLASNVGIKEEIASKIIDRLVRTFPVAFDWVTSQSADGDNMAVDRFGRIRRFEGHALYKIRNFCVQSPASMICLRKLVRLHESLSGLARPCFHVHDGYYMVCAKNDVESVCEVGTRVLEEEDEMFPGLKLRTACCFGNSLDDMKPVKKGHSDETHT